MAYGFLRRVFEVFERFRTAVDMVTTSEVSVSVTVDDRRNLDAIVQALSEFAEVSIERELALLCAVGDSLQDEPEIAARVVSVLEEVPLKMISQAASRRNITVVLRQTRSAARDAAAPRGVLRMTPSKLLHRRLREDGPDGGGDGRRSGHRDRRARGRWARRVARRRMSRWTSRPPVRCSPTFRSTCRSRMPVVIGTTGWGEHAAKLRRRCRAGRPGRGRVGEFLDRREYLSARGGGNRADDAGPAAVRRVGPRDPPQRQARCAVGHGHPAAGRDEGAPASTVRSTCRRAGPARFPALTRSDSTVLRIRSS